MADTRIYKITDTRDETDDNPGGKQYLVRAGNGSQAVRHVTRNRFDVEVASQEALVKLMVAGVKVEDATAEPSAPAA